MVNNSNTAQLQEIDVTMAQVLKHASYDTALFGKYSIGSQMGVTDSLSKGFDTWYGMYALLEGHRQYPHFLWRDNQQIRIEENEGGGNPEFFRASEPYKGMKRDVYDGGIHVPMIVHWPDVHREFVELFEKYKG